MTGYIYQIENLINHKSYIGQTVDFNRRKQTHIRELKNKTHYNKHLQAAWDKYGEQEFHFRFWQFDDITPEELNKLECEYIEKYDSLNNGYNLAPGGGKPPLHKKVEDDKMLICLCIINKYEGVGKTLCSILGYASSTLSALKRKTRYPDVWEKYELLTEEERNFYADKYYFEWNVKEEAIKRQAQKPGSIQAYSLTKEDYYLAFAAQELGYGYAAVANYLGNKPATVKDWFNGRSRVRDKQNYLALPVEEREKYLNKAKAVEFELYDNLKLINKNEEDVISFLCYDSFYDKKDSKIQKLFGWSEGTCYGIRKQNAYTTIKAKFNKMTEEEKKEKADKLFSSIK